MQELESDDLRYKLLLLWVTGGEIASLVIPVDKPVLGLELLGVVHRTPCRIAYVAWVDRVMGILAHRDVGSIRGKVTLRIVWVFDKLSVFCLKLS